MGVVEEELEEIELSIGEHRLLPLVTQDSPVGIEPKALELPDPLVPKVEALVVPSHLGLDVDHVDICCLLGHRVQFGQFTLDPIEQTQFEADEVVIDAHPVPGVLPVLGLDVLSFEGPLSWSVGLDAGHDQIIRGQKHGPVADLLTPGGVALDHEHQ